MLDAPADNAPGLPLTGERTVPGRAEENYWFRRHEAAYVALARHCADAVLLEAGCGEGYGADLLAAVASRVIAVDYDWPAVAHAHRVYPRLNALRANVVGLPVQTASIDVVASLQVIEHLWDQSGFLAECYRVLRPGGILVVTTPNRLTFSPGRDSPLNPFHTRELSAGELAELLDGAGLDIDFLGGLHHGARLRTLDAQHGGSLIDAQISVVLDQLSDEVNWPPQLLADVASVRATDFDLHHRDVAISLDLVAVARKAAQGSARPRA